MKNTNNNGPSMEACEVPEEGEKVQDMQSLKNTARTVTEVGGAMSDECKERRVLTKALYN